MKATQKLHEMGQSLWLDNITRGLLTSGTLDRYIHELSVTGLTSNPTIFDHAIKNSHDYDDAIRQKSKEGKSGEALFFELGLEDLKQAADLFRPIHDQTDGVDGWVSLEVSPLLAHDTAGTLAAAKALHASRGTPQSLHQDTGHPGGPARHRGSHLRGRAGQRDLAVLPRAICRRRRGVSARHRAANCRRAETGHQLCGLDVHQPLGRRGHGQGAESLRNQLGIAIAKRTYAAYRSVDRLAALAAASSTPAPARNAYYGPAPEPRTPRPPISSTSRPSPPRSR